MAGPVPSPLEWALLGALALCAALSGAILYVHARLAATHGAYTSFCNVNARVNCDLVLASGYGMLLGMPVALWGLLAYVALATLVFLRRGARGEARARATLLLVALATWNLTFSLYMAALSAFAVGALCLLCTGLYVLNVLIALLAWRLARASAPVVVLTRRRLALGALTIATALAITSGVQLTSSSAAVSHLTPEEVEARHPDFYKWYTGLPVATELPAAEHVRGPDDAAITIVEFSDFECAFCAKAFRDLRELERAHGGGLRVEFHHFPLDPECNPHVPSRVHRSACRAAIAAECAARFGRFWDYHDRLFENQQRLERDDLIATAADLGIDRAEFAACLDDPSARQRVAADADAGARLRVKSTPTLFINGHAVEGALDREAYDLVLAMEHGR